MKALLSKNLRLLAENLPKPLYLVGGAVRDFLCQLHTEKLDLDICSPISLDEFLPIAERFGFAAVGDYKQTGTVKLKDGLGQDYEFTCFRSDK